MSPPTRLARVVLGWAVSASLLTLACQDEAGPASGDALPEAQPTAAHSDAAAAPAPMAAAVETPESSEIERRAYFGDLHVHSAWSLDAFSSGVRMGPAFAYQYARGQSIPHISGEEIQLQGPPLDFIAVTDHAEYLGVSNAALDPRHPIQKLGIIQAWQSEDPVRRRAARTAIMRSYGKRTGMPALMADAVVLPVWKSLVQLANREYEPGAFTTFIGFEYSPNPQGQNLHRNVLFRDGRAPRRPFSAMDSPDPEDLWAWMDDLRTAGVDTLAIPHNANGSNGLMFPLSRSDGSPLDRDWAVQRARNEPLAEVFQIKGQSETHPLLSPADEWADFEIFDRRTTRPNLPSQPEGSYLRNALRRGLQIGEQLGHNPYALGMVGSTDGHNASSPFEENNFTGKIGSTDATPQERLAWIRPRNPEDEPLVSVATRWGAAGLAGVWAEENSRASLFDALRRRETFATSGPRIRVQLFAGWHFAASDIEADIARVGYAKGVPMGSILPPRPSAAESSSSPTFLVAALQDPNEAALERIQVVKGTLTQGASAERIFDIACPGEDVPDEQTHRCPGRAPEPDLETCVPAPQSGAAELSAWWRDPEYDSAAPAFYYVRVLQIPTCRWSTYDANRLGIPRHSGVPATLQERAVTSPVWVNTVVPQADGA